jgi:hypothetical protein
MQAKMTVFLPNLLWQLHASALSCSFDRKIAWKRKKVG